MRTKSLSPSPIAPRICKCGCNNRFQPKRRDQIYLDTQHANYAYNNGKRKEKNKIKISLDKQLAKNDRILDDFYKIHGFDNVADVPILSVQASGFDFRYHVGKDEINKKEYYFSYNHYYTIYIDENKIEKIQISKR